MAPHKCNKEKEIENLSAKVNKLDETVHGVGVDPGMKSQLASLVSMITPMGVDVKLATEFIIKYKERERLENEGDSNKNRTINRWVNIGIGIVAVCALIISYIALRNEISL